MRGSCDNAGTCEVFVTDSGFLSCECVDDGVDKFQVFCGVPYSPNSLRY